jgi:type II secretory pathway predicted ATPase ExeA
MFEKQLGLRENPFLAGHHPKYVYPSREHQEALAHLRYGIQNREPFVLITGEVGTGKTTAVYDALGEWGSRAVVALITNSALTRSELLEEICLRFGVASPGPLSKPQALVQLERLLSAVRARGELAILLLDEAQNLDRELLEEIRLLSNLEVQGEKLLQIFLVGQPELEAKLAQPELRQLRQRIAIHYRILPLSATETAHYIHHRVAVAGGNAHEMFPTDTCIEVFRITNGIPREINIVAGQALLNAFVEDSRTVTDEHVRAVEREIEFQSVLRDRSQPARPAAPEPVRETQVVAATPVPPPAPVTAPSRVAPEPALPAPAMQRPIAPPMPRPKRETVPAPGGWTPAVEPHSPPSRTREPEPVAPEIPRVTQPIAAESAAPALPSWFDDVVERRNRLDEQEAATASAPPPAPPASVPTFVPTAPREPERSYAPPAPVAPQPAGVDPIAALRTAAIDNLPAGVREDLEEENAPQKRSGVGWLVAATLVAALAISAVLLLRFGPWNRPHPKVAPATAPAHATAPPTAPPSEPLVEATPTAQTPGSTATPKKTVDPSTAATSTVRPPQPSTVAVKPPAPTPVNVTPAPALTASPSKPTGPGTAGGATVAPLASATPPAVKKPAVPARLFGIAVGTYLNEDRAAAERTSLTESTRLPSRVLTVSEDSVSMYRVVMGLFENRVTAEKMASDLIRKGLVNEARVVSLVRGPQPQP